MLATCDEVNRQASLSKFPSHCCWPSPKFSERIIALQLVEYNTGEEESDESAKSIVDLGL